VSEHLDVAARRCLEQARAGQPRAAGELRARVLDVVLVATGGAHPLAAVTTALRSGPVPVWTKLSVASNVIVLVGVAAIGVASRRMVSDPPSSRETKTGAALQPSAAPIPTHAGHTSAARSDDVTRDEAGLRAELLWLTRVESALLQQKAPKRALRILDAEREHFAHGQLRSERAALELIAECMLGRQDAPRVASYLDSTEKGALTARVRHACATLGVEGEQE